MGRHGAQVQILPSSPNNLLIEVPRCLDIRLIAQKPLLEIAKRVVFVRAIYMSIRILHLLQFNSTHINMYGEAKYATSAQIAWLRDHFSVDKTRF